jgi:hypothetical protein
LRQGYHAVKTPQRNFVKDFTKYSVKDLTITGLVAYFVRESLARVCDCRGVECSVVRLREHLHDRKDAVLERWLDETYSSYAKETKKFFKREKNPFANPVGGGLRTNLPTIFEGLLAGDEPDRVRDNLEAIIKVRAIQDFTPAQALSFLFRLKPIIREELHNSAKSFINSEDLAGLEDDIDRIALLAFDIFVECREKVYELRINEVKRGVAALWTRFDGRDDDSSSDPDPSEGETSQRGGVQ